MRKVTNKQLEKNKIKREETEKMFSFFSLIWKERRHNSEVSGKWLGKEALSVFFHHILPKSKYPDARYDGDNIILLTFDEHAKVENDPKFFEEINRRREMLKKKYD